MKTETILELADKATENTSDNASDQFCLAFAELIIRECANVASVNQHQYNAVGDYVLKHFGIGE